VSGDPDVPTMAFLYDRCATSHKGLLDYRLAACREYAVERRWEVAGEWVDRGDLAVTNAERPQMTALLGALADAARTGRTVVCLVHDWGRLAHEAGWNASMRYRIAQAGGWTETANGEKDAPRGAVPGRSS
jgi:Resolvase, N terminal domain